jgi:integrase
MADLAGGKKLLGITLGEMVELYLKWRQLDVAGRSITQGRLVTIKSQLVHLVNYKGKNIRLSELGRESLHDYAQWRRTTGVGAADVTIKNEQATLNHLMRYAYRMGYSHFDKFEFAPLRIAEPGRRDTFSLDEYDSLVRALRRWCSKAEAPDEPIRAERCMVRDCIFVASNTMLRVGELWQLRWGDIEGYETTTDDLARSRILVTLRVRAEIAKNRKTRLITTRGGQFFKRLKTRSSFTDPNDYIFCGRSGGERFSKRKFYAAWEVLMDLAKIQDHKKRKVTWYSLRHFGVTCRLRAGASSFDVAKIVGTGTNFIDQHYGHFDQAMSRAVALKNYIITKDGIDFEGAA